MTSVYALEMMLGVTGRERHTHGSGWLQVKKCEYPQNWMPQIRITSLGDNLWVAVWWW